MATINMVLQGKGGVGKSLVSSLAAQYQISKGRTTVCIDTDPVNATLAGYKAFKAIPLDIMNGNDDVDPRQFDKLVETMLELPEETQLIVDNGAATFLPFCSYLAENAVFELLEQQSRTVKLHSVLTGGQATLDTLSGLSSLLNSFPGIPLIIWLNPFFGPIQAAGKSFEEMSIFTENAEAYEAVIRLPHRRQATFGEDMESMLKDRLTFEQATSDASSYGVMQKQRLSMLWREIVNEIDKANL